MDPNDLMVSLGWQILEHKWRYYVGRAHGIDTISDQEYDELEDKYVGACMAVGEEPYSNVVGFTFERASCRIVHEKMCNKYGLIAKDCMVIL